MSKPEAVRIIVRGHVQGVFFRVFTADHARELGINGSARNCPDGVVEIYAEGDRVKLEELISYVKIGPPAARVQSIELNWMPYTGKYSGFAILSSED